jgi:RND family efflux transporter MFP subunit
MKHFSIHFALLFLFSLFVFEAGPAAGDDHLEFQGLIEPNELVNVGSPVQGIVAHINVQRSSTVTKGEPLVLLDSSVQSAVVERARVLMAVEGEIKLFKEKLAFAQRTHARSKMLFESEAISAEKNDQAITEVSLARNQLQKAMENRSLAKLDLEHAQVVLDQRTIKSPISGVVVDRLVSPGEFVDNQPLLILAQIDPLRVEVILPAGMFQKIQLGMKADIKPEIEVDGSYTATVAIVDRVIDPASGTFSVRLKLPNPDYRLPSGLKCMVRFIDDAKLKISTPQGLIGKKGTNKPEQAVEKKPILTSASQ